MHTPPWKRCPGQVTKYRHVRSAVISLVSPLIWPHLSLRTCIHSEKIGEGRYVDCRSYARMRSDQSRLRVICKRKHTPQLISSGKQGHVAHITSQDTWSICFCSWLNRCKALSNAIWQRPCCSELPANPKPCKAMYSHKTSPAAR